jgi:hypothetical protein
VDDVRKRSDKGNFGIPKPLAAVGIMIGGLAAIGVPWVAVGYGIDHRFAMILSLVGISAGSALILLSVLYGRNTGSKDPAGNHSKG